MLATVCLTIACKIDYFHIKLADFMKFYHENKKGPKKRKPFEEVIEDLRNQFLDIELKALKCMGFDFNFDLPHECLRYFRDKFFFSDIDEGSLCHKLKPLLSTKDKTDLYNQAIAHFYHLVKRSLAKQYLLPLCLYFPAPILTASALIIANHLFNNLPFLHYKSGLDYLSQELNLTNSILDIPN